MKFGNIKELVCYVLGHYPYTRNDDTALYAQCCRELGAKTIDDIERIGLSIISVHKNRQKIQNQERRFLPSKEVQEARKRRAKEIRKNFHTYHTVL